MAVVSEQIVPGQATYLPQLDGLRAVLASYVVIHHAFYQVWPPEYRVSPPLLVQRTLSWLHYGHYAVDVFIVLSGFVLTLPVVRNGGLRGGARRFLIGRFWRIVPPFYCAIALSVLLLATMIGAKTGTHWDYSTNWTWRTVFASVGFMHDWLGEGGLNYVFWSVAVEVKIYLIFPLIVATWGRFGLVPTAIVLAGLGLGLARFSRAVFGLELSYWYNTVPWYLALFLTGMVAAMIATSTDRRWVRYRGLPWGWFSVLGSIGLVGLAYGKGLNSMIANLDVIDAMVGLVAALGLIALVTRPGLVSRLLETRALVFVGTFAYSLYLVHAPLLQVIHQYLIAPLRLTRGGQFIALAGLGYPLILLASYGFFVVCERPFLPRRRVQAESAELNPPNEFKVADS